MTRQKADPAQQAEQALAQLREQIREARGTLKDLRDESRRVRQDIEQFGDELHARYNREIKELSDAIHAELNRSYQGAVIFSEGVLRNLVLHLCSTENAHPYLLTAAMMRISGEVPPTVPKDHFERAAEVARQEWMEWQDRARQYHEEGQSR